MGQQPWREARFQYRLSEKTEEYLLPGQKKWGKRTAHMLEIRIRNWTRTTKIPAWLYKALRD